MPRFVRVLNKGLIAGVLVGALGFFIKSVPCRITPTSSISLSICKLPSIIEDLPANSTNVYYGISNNPATGLVFQIIAVTAIVSLVLMILRKKAARVLDLTNKK